MVRVFNQYVSTKALVLMIIEAFLIVFGFFIGANLPLVQSTSSFDPTRFSVEALGVLALIQFSFYCNDLYDFGAMRSWRREIVLLMQSLAAAVAVFGLVWVLVPVPVMSAGAFLTTLALTVTSVPLVRMGLGSLWPVTRTAHKVLILGTGELASAVAREFARREDLKACLVGFVGESSADPFVAHLIKGPCDQLCSLVSDHRVSRIIVAMEDWRGNLPNNELMTLRISGVRVEDAHTALARLTGRVWLLAVRPSWLTLFVLSDGFHWSPVRAVVKRIMDLCFGILGLVVSAPLQLLVAAAIYLECGRPIIYRQKRVGLRGKSFDLLKFRSMLVEAEFDGRAQWARQNDPRVTRIGRYLRKYRLDEIPQFINVIRGEMSFVGPRPERPFFVEQLRQRLCYYDLRHMVRPGITGWAQVRQSYSATIEDSLRKLEYDLFYLKNASLLLDCSIIVQSIRTVLLGRGGR